VVSVVLLVVTGATLAIGVAALVVGLAGDGAYDHAAILLAGRLASSASVLAVVTAVWFLDGMHHAARTDPTTLRSAG
jgi:hypothetical protein